MQDIEKIKESQAARILSRLPLDSRKLKPNPVAASKKKPSVSAPVPASSPASSKAAPVHHPNPPSRNPLSTENRIKVTNLARRGPLTVELLRYFIFRYYKQRAAYKIGDFVSMRAVSVDGSWKEGPDGSSPLVSVRIENIHCGKREGVPLGKTLAFWRYEVSYEGAKGGEREKALHWDVELGEMDELTELDGPGILENSDLITNNVQALFTRNPFNSMHEMQQQQIAMKRKQGLFGTTKKPEPPKPVKSFLGNKPKPADLPPNRFLLSDKLTKPPAPIQPNQPKDFQLSQLALTASMREKVRPIKRAFKLQPVAPGRKRSSSDVTSYSSCRPIIMPALALPAPPTHERLADDGFSNIVLPRLNLPVPPSMNSRKRSWSEADKVPHKRSKVEVQVVGRGDLKCLLNGDESQEVPASPFSF